MSARPRIALLLFAAAIGTVLLLPSGAAAIPAGKIEGTVIDSITTNGIEELEVCALDPVELEFVACTETGANGEYALTGLADGDYIVEFWAPYLGYMTQFFDGAPSPEAATEVSIAGGATVAGVDAEMDKGGRIEGRVTDAATNAGIGGAEVCAFSEGALGCTLADGVGGYALIAVPTGSYVVAFSAPGYEVRYYNEKTTFAAADPVSVVAPNATTGIDMRLGEPAPPVVTPPAPVMPTSAPPQKPKLHCRKGFKKVRRHGRNVCVKRHRKKHHRRHHRR